MSKYAELRSQAEIPVWLEPLARRVAEQLRPELADTTASLQVLQGQLQTLLEVHLSIAEALQKLTASARPLAVSEESLQPQ